MDPNHPAPHHRHQSSLEGIIDLLNKPEPLGAEQRSRAEEQFYRIVRRFENAQEHTVQCNNGTKYNGPNLVRLTYEYALSQESKDIFLRAFFDTMALSLDSEDDIDLETDQEDHLGTGLKTFADYLFENFFFPSKKDERRYPSMLNVLITLC